MICYLFPKPIYLLFSSDVPVLLYYTYIPITVVVLLIGFYVLWNNRNALLNRLLFIISVLFSLWTMSALIEWTNVYSDFMLFIWNFQGMIFGLIAIYSIYFMHVFLNKNDVLVRTKVAFLALLAPIFVATPTLYLKGFDITNCDAFEFSWRPFEIYYTLLGVLAMVWILILIIRKYRATRADFRKQIVLMGVGIELFLFSFFTVIFLAAYLTDIGILADSRLEFYGLLGMVVFIGLLAYLIVKFKAFNVKIIATEALMVALIIITGSELFFVENTINKVLVSITLALSLGFGYVLIRTVRNEVDRKEELQFITKELEVSNTRLRELDRTKSEFISIASHQLRTPLTAIKGFVSLLLEGSYGEINAEARSAIEKVSVSNERLISLVEDLLSLSRIESGRMEYKLEEIDLEKICREIYETFFIGAKDKSLHLDILASPEKLPSVKADYNKVREVVSNLVDNALKYTENGGVKIKLELSDDKKNIRVSITDTGIGVPKEEIPYLFQKFSRGRNTSRLVASGSGLGLHVGKLMMEAMHGQIGVDSEGDGKGSTFWVKLPVA